MSKLLCGCVSRCGDDGDTEGPGTCKGLPELPKVPLVVFELVPRRAAVADRQRGAE